jgi:hypothetical protein
MQEAAVQPAIRSWKFPASPEKPGTTTSSVPTVIDVTTKQLKTDQLYNKEMITASSDALRV